IRLSRNFGKESAICAGLAEACGDCCVVIDADMQHPPEYIPEMVEKWKNEGCMVVEGVKTARGRENIFKKISALLFYRTLNAFCGIDLRNASDFRLLDRKAIDAWKAMPERETFFRAMSTWIGYKRGTVSIDIEERKSGVTRWSRSRLMRLAVSAITSFSSIPLYIVTVMGFIFLVLAMALGIQTIVKKFTGASVEGFTTVILLLLIIGSILMISLGIIGIYIARIYDEVKHRPRYLIEKIEGGGKD
ncbi:MAG: glycosyltransferase family 2 protein, partial [Eubacteriales bacterium]|nr:glycosyltransferase family 2 protein [Eubacteriales bacterium]